MGDSKIAECASCGYSSGTLLTGGGMRSFRTYDAQPVHCASCGVIRTANLKVAPLSCLMCGGVGVTALQGLGPTSCPKCGKAELRFRKGGIKWD
jgi:hypothetical protein